MTADTGTNHLLGLRRILISAFARLEVFPENCRALDSITLSFAHVLNVSFALTALSLFSANHMEGRSRPAEKPLPAHAGQIEEEDGEGESLKQVLRFNGACCSVLPVVTILC